jgi:N4-gp56 family major capsid protein
MASDVTTTGTLTVTMATYYSKVFLEKARLILRHDAFAQKRGIPANSGKTVYFTRHTQPAVATTAITEGTNPTAVTVSGATVSTTLSEYGSYTNISKFYERTSIDVGLKEQVEAMGINMGESIDTIIRTALVASGGVSQYTLLALLSLRRLNRLIFAKPQELSRKRKLSLSREHRAILFLAL